MAKTNGTSPISDDDLDDLIGADPAPQAMLDEVTNATLELSTTEPEPLDIGIKIDDVFYPYSDPSGWNLAKRSRYARLWQGMKKLEEKSGVTDADEIRYNKLAHELIQMVTPDIPTEKIDGLNMGNRIALVMDFFIKAAKRSPLLQVAMTTGRR